MPFTAEEIEAMSPAIRVEIQDWLVTQHFARQRRAAVTPDPPRKGNGWVHPWRDEVNSITAIFRQRRMAIPRG